MKDMKPWQQALLAGGVTAKVLLVSALLGGAIRYYREKHDSSDENTNNTTQATQPPSTNTTSDYADYSTQLTTPNLDR